jgi:hypothetical protein
VLGRVQQRDDSFLSRLPHSEAHRELTMSPDKNNPKRLNAGQVLALRGLRLPGTALKQLQQTGIYCEPSVSIEHQHLAQKYVIRGVESGGGVAELGHYVGFVDAHGRSLPWIQRVHSVGRNGLHAIVVASQIVRLQMFRRGQTYDLLITQHHLESVQEGRRPTLQNKIIFHGIRGTLALDLWREDSHFSGLVTPAFLTRSGEHLLVPEMLLEAVCRITAAASCVGCCHCHLLRPDSDPPVISISEGKIDDPKMPNGCS